MNDALLSGSADFISAGPPAFLILWDRTKSSAKVKGVAAMSTMPMYLNTRADIPHPVGPHQKQRQSQRDRCDEYDADVSQRPRRHSSSCGTAPKAAPKSKGSLR